MMADTDEKINKCIKKSLNYLSAIGRHIVLKCEQRISIQHLLLGTGFYRVCFGKGFVEVALLAMTEKYKTIIKLTSFTTLQTC